MANRAYASIWLREFSLEAHLERWRSFLATVPRSANMPGFSHLVIRAVDESEAPILEDDLRSIVADESTLAELTQNHVNGDCSYQTEAFWDLWVYDAANLRWEQAPQPLEIFCFGEEFDEAEWQSSGHFLVDVGFEHLFTGHAKLLGAAELDRGAIRHPEEQRFVSLMSQPQNLTIYREKTQENIRKLYEWMRQLEGVLPLARTRLWSEGEENLEARMEDILARH